MTRKYLEYPAIIDWLQWGDFDRDDTIGSINYPQLTLTMISGMKKEIKELSEENEKLKSEQTTIRVPIIGTVK